MTAVDLEIICSMEHEYGLYGNKIEAHGEKVDRFINFIDEDLILFKQNCGRVFLKNGMLVYRDMSLLEIALPECSSAYEIVCYDQAANKIIENASKKTGVVVFKNNVEKQKRSFGCHENYFYELKAPLDAKKEYAIYRNIYSKIAPFLLTRYIIIGNGNYCDGQYTLSQRIPSLLQAKTDANAPSTRVLFHRRDEEHCTNGLRIHITSGDSNISEFSNYLKMGMTGIVLKMIEQEFISQRFEVLDLMRTLEEINSDMTCKNRRIIYRKFRFPRIRKILPFLKTMEKRECKNAVQIQEMYLGMAEKFAEKHGIKTDVVKNWRWVLNAMKKNPELLENKLDWMIKKNLINLAEDESVKENINLQYHALGGESFFSKIAKQFGIGRITAETDVEKAIYEPPNTRALTRKQLVEKLNKDNCTIKKLDWDSIIFIKSNAPYKINMNTPFYIPLDSEKLQHHIYYV